MLMNEFLKLNETRNLLFFSSLLFLLIKCMGFYVFCSVCKVVTRLKYSKCVWVRVCVINDSSRQFATIKHYYVRILNRCDELYTHPYTHTLEVRMNWRWHQTILFESVRKSNWHLSLQIQNSQLFKFIWFHLCNQVEQTQTSVWFTVLLSSYFFIGVITNKRI